MVKIDDELAAELRLISTGSLTREVNARLWASLHRSPGPVTEPPAPGERRGEDADPASCRHPINRRIGKFCALCGTEVRPKRTGL